MCIEWVLCYVGFFDLWLFGIFLVYGDMSGLLFIVMQIVGDDLICVDVDKIEIVCVVLKISIEYCWFVGMWYDFYLQVGLFFEVCDVIVDFGVRLCGYFY